MRIKLRNAIKIAIASVLALTITNINGIKTSVATIASQT